MIDDYRKHAVVWDWDGFDNSLEYEYWCKYARQYGKKVLIPMRCVAVRLHDFHSCQPLTWSLPVTKSRKQPKVQKK